MFCIKPVEELLEMACCYTGLPGGNAANVFDNNNGQKMKWTTSWQDPPKQKILIYTPAQYIMQLKT